MVKITALTNEPTPVAADLVAIVDDVAVSATTKKATLDNVLAVYDSQTATMTNKTLTSPILTTPALGTPSSGTLTSCTGLPITGITSATSAQIATLCSNETGSGLLVFGTSPTLVTPVLGTPASGTLTNCTFPTLNQNTTGNAATVTTNANLTGDVTSSGNATTIASGSVDIGMVSVAAKTEMIAIALGDESTVLSAASTSVPVVTYHMPYAFTLTNVKVGCTVAGTGAALLTVDVHEAGTTVLSTKVTVDASEKTSGTAATAMVISDSALAADSLIEVFVDLIDTDNVAAGVKVYLIGYQT